MKTVKENIDAMRIINFSIHDVVLAHYPKEFVNTFNSRNSK